MAIKQLSVFIENKQGKLSDAVKIISEADINIRALSIADTKDFGILRLIVSDSEKAKAILSETTIVNVTDVVAVKMTDEQGALYEILKVLEEAKVNVEYTYAFTAHTSNGAYVVIRVNDTDSAEAVLKAKGIDTLSDSDIKDL